MFWLGFISAFGVASVVLIVWMQWDARQQLNEIDRENTELLLRRISRLEGEVFGGPEKAWKVKSGVRRG